MVAHITPNTPFPGSSSEVIRLFQVLRRLPDSVVVQQRVPTLHGPGPDFWLLRQDCAFFFFVCPATTQTLQQQPTLFAGEIVAAIGEAEATWLDTLQQTIPDLPTIPAGLLFPNLNQKQVSAIPLPAVMQAGVGKEQLTPTRLSAWLDGRFHSPLTPPQITHLRQYLLPEVIVPQQFTVHRHFERGTEAALSPYLLDYNQEHALKMDLSLPQTGHKTAKDFSLRLINGVAGSGKSLIVIYRAYMLRRLYPGKRILVLTHNRALVHDLRRRYNRLSKGDRGVKMYTFMGWCRRYWPDESHSWRQIILHRERLELATQIWYNHLADTAVSEQMLLSEIDWYKDRLLFSEADYVASDRTGRGFALIESMRRRVYEAMRVYHEKLQQRQLMDWGDVPRQMWRFISRKEIKVPTYDVILVDEAQFFAPIWFEVIKLILQPEHGHLFLVADASQGFLKRGQSWLASGLQVRGRVHRLNKSYRTTRQILDFATLLYHSRLPEEDAEIIIPDLAEMPNGVLPVVIPLTSEQDEVTRVINEIRRLVQGGVPWQHILVIHASRSEIRHILERLNQAFGSHTAVDPAQSKPKQQIRVCSLNAATGLESPIVFLMGTHDLYEMEQSIRLSEEERAELIRDNTRKLYMALTRAGQRLVLTYVGPLPETLKGLATQSA